MWRTVLKSISLGVERYLNKYHTHRILCSLLIVEVKLNHYRNIIQEYGYFRYLECYKGNIFYTYETLECNIYDCKYFLLEFCLAIQYHVALCYYFKSIRMTLFKGWIWLTLLPIKFKTKSAIYFINDRKDVMFERKRGLHNYRKWK